MIDLNNQFYFQEEEEEEEKDQLINETAKASESKQIQKKKRTYKTRVSKKALELQQKQRNLQRAKQLIASLCKVPSGEYKYFIRGDLLVDFDFLIDEVPYKQAFFGLNDYKPAREVLFNKADNYYEIHFDQGQEQIQNFNFIIEMLNSLGNNRIHHLATILENYLNALSILDKSRDSRSLSQLLDNDIMLEEDNSYSNWNFDCSLQKANLLLKEKLQDPDNFFYIISKGHKDYSELVIYGINNTALKMILGNIDHESTVKILLQNGMIVMSQDFTDVLQLKIFETMPNLSQNVEPEQMSYSRKVPFITINNLKLDINFTYEKHRLSNYKDRFNDSVIFAKISSQERQNLMNQLFFQKLVSDTSVSEEKLLLSDITYQAQSEYFMEKFYTKNLQKQNLSESTS
ncbi:hypothetical protein ABPG72_011127 [Tetrahymena utriculariae]